MTKASGREIKSKTKINKQRSQAKNQKIRLDKTNTKKIGFREMFHLYLNDKIKMERYQEIGIAFLIFVIAGVVGWIYEFFVALVETGEVYMQGGNLLPWINIYAFGAILVVPLTYKLRKYPWAVFLVSAVATGLVELIGGWLVYTIGNGTRYWNYDHGLWLIGNINGFVCLLSVVIFGLGCLVLIYLVMPVCIYLARKMSRRAFLTLAIVLFGAIMIDEIVNLVLKNNNLPNAMDLYRELGFKYQEF